METPSITDLDGERNAAPSVFNIPDLASPNPQDTLLGCTRSRAVGFAREVAEEFQRQRSDRAVSYLCVGHFEAAIDTAFDDGDPITWAAASCLAGYPYRARRTLEALVAVAVSRCSSGKHDPLTPFSPNDNEWHDTEPMSPKSTGVLYSKVNDLLDRVQVTRWYYIALCLDATYAPPELHCVREYFRLAHPKAVVEMAGARSPPELRRVIESLMARQLSTTQITFARAVVSWQQARYASALQLTSTYLGLSTDASDVDETLMRFIRVLCNVRTGAVAAATEDALSLGRRTTSAFVKAVGSAIRAPLMQKQEYLREAATLPPADARYATFLAFHVQLIALTLRGNFAAAYQAYTAVLAHVPAVAFWAAQHHDTAVISLIALRDTKNLRVNLCSQVGQAHVWVSRYYGADPIERAENIVEYSLFSARREHGPGHSEDDARTAALKNRFDAYLSSNESTVPPCDQAFEDARLALVANFARAYANAHAGDLEGAWRAMDEAVGSALELVGSAELSFSSAAPVRVFAAAIHLGLLFLQQFPNHDARSDVLQRVKDIHTLFRQYYQDHILYPQSHAALYLLQEDVDEALTVAKKTAIRFGGSIYAQSLLALCHLRNSNHEEARIVATQQVSTFPHSATTRLVYRAVANTNFLLKYNYRGVLPVTLADGPALRHWFRTAVIGVGLFAHFILFVAIAVANVYDYAQNKDITSTSPTIQRLDAFSTELVVGSARVTFAVLAYAAALFIFVGLPSVIAVHSHLSLVLRKLRFVDSRGVRVVWCLRVLPFANATLAFLAFFTRDMRLLHAESVELRYQYVILAGFACCCLPFTTRFLAVRSEDEPAMWLHWWLAVLVVDVLTFPFTLVLHCVLLLLEPFAAFSQLITHDRERPFNSSRVTRIYAAVWSMALAKTQPLAPTSTAGLEEDIERDKSIFPMILSGNAGALGFELHLTEDEELHIRRALGSRREKNQRVLDSMKQRRQSLLRRRAVLAGVEDVEADGTELETTQNVDVTFEEMILRRVPHAKDDRRALITAEDNAAAVALYDGADAAFPLRLAVPELTLTLERRYDLDVFSAAPLLQIAMGVADGVSLSQVMLRYGKSALPALFAEALPDWVSPDRVTRSRSNSRTALSRAASATQLARTASNTQLARGRSGLLTPAKASRASSRDSARSSNPLSTTSTSPAPLQPVIGRSASFAVEKRSTNVSELPAPIVDATLRRDRSMQRRQADTSVTFIQAVEGFAQQVQSPPDSDSDSEAPSLKSASKSRGGSAASFRREAPTAPQSAAQSAGSLSRSASFSTVSTGFFQRHAAEKEKDAALANAYLSATDFVLPLPDADEPSVDRTQVVVGHVDTLRRISKTIDGLVQKASSEKEMRQLDELQKELTRAKHNFAGELTLLGKSLSVGGKINADHLEELIADLVASPETNNLSLLQMMLGKFARAMNLGQCAYSKGWCTTAIRDGKARYLALLLQLPGACEAIVTAKKVVDLLQQAARNDKARIPLVSALLRCGVKLQLHTRRAELEAFWGEFLDTVANIRRIRGVEDSTGRLGLVYFICTTPELIRPCHEKPRRDGLTLFSRACRDGDEDVVKMMLDHGLVRQPNEASPKDGATPLVLATLGGHRGIVERLVVHPQVDVLMEVKGKTAYLLAQEQHKNPLLIAVLRKATQAASTHWEEAPAQTAARQSSMRRTSMSLVPTPPSQSLIGGAMAGAPSDFGGFEAVVSGEYASSSNGTPAAACSPVTAQQLPPAEVGRLFARLRSILERKDLGDPTVDTVTVLRVKQESSSMLAVAAGSIVISKDAAVDVTEVLDRLFTEGDRVPSNVGLVRSIILNVRPPTYDLPSQAVANEWLVVCAKNGSDVFLGLLLNVAADVPLEQMRNVIVASSRHENRLKLVTQLLAHARCWRGHRTELKDLWQTYFENVGYASESFESERAADRVAVLQQFLQHRDITIDVSSEAEDGHTVFSRACAYGDLLLVQFLLEQRIVSDPNVKLSDGTTPLVQAVCENHVQVVEYLLQCKAVKPELDVKGSGTALDIAEKLKRHPRIIEALRAAFGIPTSNRADNNASFRRQPSMRR
jgi:ankyrin repeat protein